MKIKHEQLEAAYEWVRSDKKAVSRDVKRLGIESAAEYQVSLADEQPRYAGKFTADAMAAVLRNME